MKLTTRQKHEMGVKMISGYLDQREINHTVVDKDPNIDIHLPDHNKSIKVICNHSRSPSVKVGKDFEPLEGVLYLMVAPTDKNNLGFTCRGGERDEIEQSLISFMTPGAPKNIDVKSVPGINIDRHAQSQ